MCTSSMFMDSITKDMSAILEQNEKFVAKNDWKNAKNEMDKLYNIWESHHSALSVIANHAMIDEIDYAISRTLTTIDLRESGNYFEESRILKLKVNDLKEHQKINISNLF